MTAQSSNTRLVGVHDLQGRSALQVTLRGDWCYVGHLPGHGINPLTGADEPNGTSILDVSDPTRPVLVSHIPAGPKMNCRSVQMITSPRDGRDYLIRNHEGVPDNMQDEHALEVFDVTDRAKPALVSRITATPYGPLTWAHKGWWDEGSGLYFASIGEVGFRRGAHLCVWDLSDPARPVFVGRHWITGQHESEPAPGERGLTLHHPVVDMANGRAYLGYARGGQVLVVDIADPAKPSTILEFTISPTFNKGPHTVIPYLGVRCPNFAPGIGDVRDLIVFVNEANNAKPESREVRTMVYMLDVTAPENPMTIDTWRVPDHPFASAGGRFGPHQFAETRDGRLYSPAENGHLLYVAWFNAGLRVLDIADPFSIREVGHFVPETTARTKPLFGKTAIQTNDVDIDHRGLLYLTDRAGTGLHVVAYERPAAW